MAQVKIYARRAHLERVRSALSDAIHSALQATLGLPADLRGHGRVAFLPYGVLILKAPKPNRFRDPPESLADHLRKRRHQLGLLQRDVALLMNTSQDTIMRWEQGYAPRVSMVPRIIAFLGYAPYPHPLTSGEQVAYQRQAKGLSRRKLAALLGIDESTVEKMEKDKLRVTGHVSSLFQAVFSTLHIR